MLHLIASLNEREERSVGKGEKKGSSLIQTRFYNNTAEYVLASLHNYITVLIH